MKLARWHCGPQKALSLKRLRNKGRALRSERDKKRYSHTDLEEHPGKRVNPRINVDNSRRVKAKDAHFLVAPRAELAFPNLAKGYEFGFWSLTELSWNPGSVN